MSEIENDLVHNWLDRAYSDLQLGKIALEAEGVLPEDACFHAQQSVEKSLKALLIFLDIDYPRTHVIEVLLEILKSKGLSIPEQVDEAYVLTQYAVQTRYPGDWEPVTLEEAISASNLAAIVLSWVKDNIRSSRENID